MITTSTTHLGQGVVRIGAPGRPAEPNVETELNTVPNFTPKPLPVDIMPPKPSRPYPDRNGYVGKPRTVPKKK